MMRAHIAATLLASIATLTGCGFDTDSLYGESNASGNLDAAAAPRTPAALPQTYGWVPGIPDDGFEESCVECAKENCGHERNLCLDPAYPDCWDNLVCASRCDDPDCLQQCESAQFVSALACERACGDTDDFCRADCWEGRDRYNDLRECLFDDACTEACNAHRNWQCLDDYSWGPATTNDPITVRLSLSFGYLDRSPLNGIPGALVERCIPPCALTHLARETDAFGNVTFDDVGTPATIGFDARFEHPTPMRVMTYGAFRGYRSFELSVPARNLFNPAQGSLPNGGLAGQVLDCLASGAVDVRVASDKPDVVVAYNSRTDRSDATGLFWFEGMPWDETTTITASRADDGTDVASIVARVPEGAHYLLNMMPRWQQ